MRLIDADALMDNMFRYAAPEMMWDRADIIHKIDEMPTIEPERIQALKDCTNCKHGHYNDHYGIPFCYNPDNCDEWNLWEPKDIEPER